MKRPDRNWIVLLAKGVSRDYRMADGGAMCLRCGKTQPFVYPSPIEVISAMSKAFEGLHKDCMAHPEGDTCTACGGRGHALPECKTAKATTPDQWFHGPDTGASSTTIWSVMMGRPGVLGTMGSYEPLDPDDFGRCYRLLRAFPEWRERMPEVAAKYPRWAGLVAAWDELTALYEEEIQRRSGRAPKLYRRIQEALGRRPMTGGFISMRRRGE